MKKIILDFPPAEADIDLIRSLRVGPLSYLERVPKSWGFFRFRRRKAS